MLKVGSRMDKNARICVEIQCALVLSRASFMAAEENLSCCYGN